MKQTLALWITGIVLAAAGCQAGDPVTSGADAPGIQVGATAPGFDLVDQHGQNHSLTSLLKDGQMLAIVFHRSADW